MHMCVRMCVGPLLVVYIYSLSYDISLLNTKEVSR